MIKRDNYPILEFDDASEALINPSMLQKKYGILPIDKLVITFFKEVKSEVSKVKWPTKKDMFKYSLATIIFVVFFALFFYLIDLIIALLKAGV